MKTKVIDLYFDDNEQNVKELLFKIDLMTDIRNPIIYSTIEDEIKDNTIFTHYDGEYLEPVNNITYKNMDDVEVYRLIYRK